MITAAPGLLTRTLLATDPALLARVTAEERERARLILTELMPIRPRARGMRNDGRYSGAPVGPDLAAIRVPTLVISAEDDLFGTAGTARLIAATIPGAWLVIYPEGGHIWLGHDADVAREIAAHVAAPKTQEQRE